MEELRIDELKPLREYLDILFHRVQPEVLVANMEASAKDKIYTFHINSSSLDLNAFQHYSYKNFRGYSADEVENFYRDLICKVRDESLGKRHSIFNLIPLYMKDVVVIRDNIPCCKYLEMLNWRSISQELGQNLLLMGYLAHEDWKKGKKRNFFAWNSIIGTDSKQIRGLLLKGVAENHYHLYGSTQVFSLSWACLMNHPRKIMEFFKHDNAGKRMQENLNENISLGTIDNQFEWPKRLYIACWIRKQLFYNLKNPWKEEDEQQNMLDFIQFMDKSKLEDDVSALRGMYGHRFPQPGIGGDKCLDYAVENVRNNYLGFEYNSFLTGERKFLYDCFYNCYNGRFSEHERDLFYLYIVIKSQFRSELVQVNQRVGFHNFSEYQDRKADFWWNVQEYQHEAYKLAIHAPIKGENIVSLEARITPTESYAENIRRVLDIDKHCAFIEHKKIKGLQDIKEYGVEQNYFFVIHFLKSKQEGYGNERNDFMVKPRNWYTREKSKRWAKKLAKSFEQYPYYGERVWGIDACSTEIGCRPETFATEFRFLRHVEYKNSIGDLFDDVCTEKMLYISYHVGEDFFDIIDGLRAIDEAVSFLELDRGDRLGHALALGINPAIHYDVKRRLIPMSKQDLLDNTVWLLFRSLELGVEMKSQLRSSLEYKAKQLLYELYPDNGIKHYDLRDYYESWKLRGDNPELYREGKFVEIDKLWNDRYEEAKKSKQVLEMLRRQDKAAYLYYRYHYGVEEKKKSSCIDMAEISDEYIELVSQMQLCMQKIVMEKGIGIECNPTSNVLIGTFKRYENHPMLQFNNYALKNEDGINSTVQLDISINTDDQGVFDTSLENEYALMACALEKKKDCNGEKIYSQDAIFDYLEHIRESGINQSFREKRR